MIIISSDKLYIEEWNDEKSDYAIRDWNNDDSLIYFYGDRIMTEDGTTFENVLYAFINDFNSDAISKTLKSFTDCDDILEVIRKELKENNDYIDHYIDAIELSHVPIVNFKDAHSEPSLSTWELLGWGQMENEIGEIDKFSSMSVDSIPLNQLAELNFTVDPTVDIYDGKNFNYSDTIFSFPTVFDLIKSICYELSFHRGDVTIHKTDGSDPHQEINSQLTSLNDLLNND